MTLPEHWEQVHCAQLWWESGMAGPYSAALQAQRDGRGLGSQHREQQQRLVRQQEAQPLHLLLDLHPLPQLQVLRGAKGKGS